MAKRLEEGRARAFIICKRCGNAFTSAERAAVHPCPGQRATYTPPPDGGGRDRLVVGVILALVAVAACALWVAAG